jgi:hypothetical protein
MAAIHPFLQHVFLLRLHCGYGCGDALPIDGYHYVHSPESEVLERVQRYTAQKARVLARINAKTDPELQQLGLEGGVEMIFNHK